MSTPSHLRPALVGVVAIGGMAGTTLRYLLTTTVGSHAGFPTATFVENVVGAFLLGGLLEVLLRSGAEQRGGQLLRLGLGTGLLGGFTTFSALALEVTVLLQDGRVGLAAGYAAGSLGLGVVACLLGVAAAARWRLRRGTEGGTAR